MDGCTTRGGMKRGARAALTGDLTDYLRGAFALDPDGPFDDLGGSCNLNLMVSRRGEKYVAKVYRPYVTRERLACIRTAREAARAAVPSAELLRTDGAEYGAWDGRLIEVERYEPHDRTMNDYERLLTAMPAFARLHDALSGIGGAEGGWDQPFSNYVPAERALELTREGCARIRSWADLSDAEKGIADAAEALAERLSGLEPRLPVQLVHGDFWDNNVLFRAGEIVLVTDFDFIGLRPRVDDIALTYYFTHYEFAHAGQSDREIRERFARMTDAYCAGARVPLAEQERLALPLALARQPLWSICIWARMLDAEATARAHISDLTEYLDRSATILDSLEQWQTALS